MLCYMLCCRWCELLILYMLCVTCYVILAEPGVMLLFYVICYIAFHFYVMLYVTCSVIRPWKPTATHSHCQTQVPAVRSLTIQ